MAARTPRTRELEKWKRQFFQWFYREKKTLPEVIDYFDRLFRDINLATNKYYHVEPHCWKTRGRAWKKRWNIPSGHRGPSVPLPDDLIGSHLWRYGSSGTLDLPDEDHSVVSVQSNSSEEWITGHFDGEISDMANGENPNIQNASSEKVNVEYFNDENYEIFSAETSNIQNAPSKEASDECFDDQKNDTLGFETSNEYHNSDALRPSVLSLEEPSIYIMDVDEPKSPEAPNWPSDSQIPVIPAQSFQDLASELPYHSAPTTETQDSLNQTSQLMAYWTIDEDFLWEAP